MTRPSGIAKRLLLIALIAATFVVVQVVLAAPPNASFNVVGPNFTNTCGLWTFTSTSTDPDNDLGTVSWDIGGTARTGSPVSETLGPGSYTINMSVDDTDAVDGTVDTSNAPPQTITVGNGGAPNAAFTPNDSTPQPNQSVTFTSSSTAQGGGSIATHEWDLDGNGSYETNTGATGSAAQAYATTGFHTIRLKVTDNCGVPDEVSGSIFVNNTAPTAAFTVTPNPAAIGATVTFDGSASTDTGGSIASYEWDLDGNGSYETVTTTPTTTRTYTAAGVFNVKLRVIDNNGLPSSPAFDNLRVNAAPVANFSYAPITPLINDVVTFNGTASTDPDGTVASYAWDLDGNGSFETTGATPTHTYTAADTYNVKLRVTDSDNTQSVVLARDVIVQATKPKASFTYTPAHPLPGQAVTLRSTSAPSGSVGAPALVATQWDFTYSPLVDFTLDGAGASVVTSFATAGLKTVAIKVTETGGGFAIASGTIPVNAPPQASFTVAPAKPKEGREVTFASTSSDADGLARQEWDLNNDGTFERSGAVVSTTKLKRGTRTVKLRVTDAFGAAVTTTKRIKVAKRDLKPPFDIDTAILWSPRGRGITVVDFSVTVPKRTSVAVTCKGSGCPRGTFTKRPRAKKAELTFGQLEGRRLGGGAKINVVFRRSGYITGWDIITIRATGKDRTVLREGCKFSSRQKKQKRCP